MPGGAVGFLGVVLIQLPDGGMDIHFSLVGEGFVLFSTVLAAFLLPILRRWGSGKIPWLCPAGSFSQVA